MTRGGGALVGVGLLALAMTSGQRAVMAVCVATALVQIAGGLGVVGPWGMDGVAEVSALPVTLQALLAAVMVRHQTGLWTMPFVQARARVKRRRLRPA